MSILSDTLKNQYFQSYIQNATNSVSSIASVSQLPTEVPLETLIAIAAYKPQVLQGVQLQKYTQTSKEVQDAIAKRLQQTGIITTNLSNFRPSVLSGNVIQRRTNGVTQPLSDRDRILRGVPPATRRLVQQLEDLRALSELQAQLQRIIDKIESQITRFTAIFNALVNAPDAAASAALSVLIAKLEDLEAAYTKAKAVYELVKKVYQNTKKAILKALFKDIPKAKENLKKGLDVLGKILKLRERPRIVLFPKFPKLPRLSWSKADFYNKYKKALEVLKKKDGEFYQKAYSTAIQQAGFEIIDPKKDKLQRGLTKARNSLREARAKLETSQAIRTEAVNRARTQLINNIRNVNSTTERERLQLLQQYQNAKQQASQVGSRRMYLNSTEASQLLSSSRIDVNNKNILGDSPTGQITLDGRTVYTDRRNGKVYVLQSASERVNELTSTSTAQIRNTISEATTAVSTVNTAVVASAKLGASLNNKVLGAEFVANLVQDVNTVNNIAAQARNASSGPVATSNQSYTINELGLSQFDDYSIKEATKTVTTVTRRYTAAEAVNQATAINQTISAKYGYTTPLVTTPSGPISVTINGQQLFQLTLAIQYKDFNPLNQARIEELGRQPTTTVTTNFTVNPITAVPTSIQNTARNSLLTSAQRQQVAQLERQITNIDEKLNSGINDDGTIISGEDRAALRAQRVALRDQIEIIRTPRPGAQMSVTTLQIPDNLTQPITPNIPLPQARLPQDRVEQSGPIIIVTLSRTDSPQGRNGLTVAVADAQRLSTARAAQTGLVGTPKTKAEYRQRGDISGQVVYELSFTADYTQPTQTSQEGSLAQRQLQVNSLLQQGITPAQINSQYSPPGPVDENGNIL